MHKKRNKNDELNDTLGRLVQLGGTQGCSNSVSSGSVTSNTVNSGATSTGEESPSNSTNKKSGGGLFKKLKEKRAKKRSIVGQEPHDGLWRTGSPIGEERKSVINRKYTPKKENVDTRKESIGSHDDPAGNSTTKSPDSSRRRSWSHGNINKISTPNSFEIPLVENDHKVPHSKSTTFSSGGDTQNSQEDSVSSDKYVINGPSSGDHHQLPGYTEKRYEALYLNFGNEVHKQTLKDLQEFLDSCGEVEPLDLSIIQDWNGWVIGTTDVV